MAMLKGCAVLLVICEVCALSSAEVLGFFECRLHERVSTTIAYIMYSNRSLHFSSERDFSGTARYAVLYTGSTLTRHTNWMRSSAGGKNPQADASCSTLRSTTSLSENIALDATSDQREMATDVSTDTGKEKLRTIRYQ